MSHRVLSTSLVLGIAFTLAGCGMLKKKTPEPAPSAAVVAPVAPPPVVAPVVPAEPVVAALPPLDEGAIPAPQDFEDEAFEKVTTANFKAELARLTKEVATK